MQLLKLRVFQHRNLKDQEVSLSPGTNLFVGANGQGKTNILEAVYLIGYGKSFRTATPRECIQHGKEECRVQGTVKHGSLSSDLQVWISRRDKKLLLHGKSVALDEFVGNLHILAFAHVHLRVVRDGPGERRAFLDRAMITLYPGHIHHLMAYSKALKQRNRILSAAREAGKEVDQDLLDSWDETLVKEGSRILWNRIRYVDQIRKELPEGLFGTDVLKAHYLTTIPGPHSDLMIIESKFRQMLADLRTADVKRGFTSAGPHRDELKLFVNGKSLVNFGSAGQQRSCLLSLYLAQMEIHRKTHGFYPLFLIDDVEAELDEQRLQTFLGYLAQRTQILLTTAKGAFLSSIKGITGNVRSFKVDGGAALHRL